MNLRRIYHLLEGLRKGAWAPSDASWLEQLPADQLVEELRSSRYRLTIQERHIGRKWEISLARTFRAEWIFPSIRDKDFVSMPYMPIYIECLMLNIEDNHFNGVSTQPFGVVAMNLLSCRQIRSYR